MTELEIDQQFTARVIAFDAQMSSAAGYQGLEPGGRRREVYRTYDEAEEAGIEQARAMIVLGAGTVEVQVEKRLLVRRQPHPSVLAQSSD